MDKKIIVFDFDKTLTYSDTLQGFFKHVARKNILFPIKICSYFILMVCAYLNLISNHKLKNFGILIFLKNESASYVHKISTSYKNKIKFNKLFSEYNFNRNYRFYVVSASFEDYLKSVFPEHVVIVGSQIDYSNELVTGIKFNCYKENKLNALAKHGIFEIDVFYTDSYSDYALANISKKIMIVKDDQLHECNSIQDFNTYFGK